MISVPRATRPDCSRIRRLDLETGAARRAPDPCLARSGPAAHHLDAVGDHERRIEADAELADQPLAILGLGQPADEGARPRPRDGPEVVDHLLPVHADAGVGDGQRAGLDVGLMRITSAPPSPSSSGFAMAS